MIASERAGAAARAFDAIKNFNLRSRYGERRWHASIADFIFGDPHEAVAPREPSSQGS